jgi:hypothetical protein
MLGASLCIFIFPLMRSRPWPARIFCVSGVGGILFLTFKLGYIRTDSHETSAAVSVLLLALTMIVIAVPQKRGVRLIAIILVCFSTLFAASTLAKYHNFMSGFLPQLAGTFSPYNLLSPVAGIFTGRLSDDYEKNMKQLDDGIPVPLMTGGTDLYSMYQDVLFARGLKYCPRPVIQSYSAYTPRLAKMNADWLKTDRAATNILFAIQTIDDRFSSLDDGLSWPELLSLYDIQGLANQKGTYLLLSRSTSPRKYQLRPLPEKTASLGEPFILPATSTHNLILAEIELKKTAFGKLASFFYKPTTLSAKIELADKSKYLCRIVPGITSAGFLISPYIANNRSFLALAAADESVLTNKAVVSITIFDDKDLNASSCYRPQMKIRFYQLVVPPQKFKIEPMKIPAKDLPGQ